MIYDNEDGPFDIRVVSVHAYSASEQISQR